MGPVCATENASPRVFCGPVYPHFACMLSFTYKTTIYGIIDDRVQGVLLIAPLHDMATGKKRSLFAVVMKVLTLSPLNVSA